MKHFEVPDKTVVSHSEGKIEKDRKKVISRLKIRFIVRSSVCQFNILIS